MKNFELDDIDFGEEKKSFIPLANRKSVSFLLGAGFSAPKGYPIGNQVNERLQNFDKNVDFAPDGSLCSSKNGSKPIFQIGGNYIPIKNFIFTAKDL